MKGDFKINLSTHLEVFPVSYPVLRPTLSQFCGNIIYIPKLIHINSRSFLTTEMYA